MQVVRTNKVPTKTTETREERKQATRAALRAAALRCFADRGYGHTQITDITHAAGVAAGTFYVHYADKAALLDEILVEFNAGLLENLMRLKIGKADLHHTLEKAADVFLEYWQEHRAFIGAYAERSSGGLGIDPLQFGLNPPMRQFMTVALEMAAKEAGVGAARAELAVQGILAMWLRLGLQALFNPGAKRADVRATLADLTASSLITVLAPRGEGRAHAEKILTRILLSFGGKS